MYGYNDPGTASQQHGSYKKCLQAGGAAAEPVVRPGTAVPQELQEAAGFSRYRVP